MLSQVRSETIGVLSCLFTDKPHSRRKARSLRPPIFPGTFPVWRWIMGETGNSGHGLGIGKRAKLQGYAALSGTFYRVQSGRPPRREIRADNGRFSCFPCKNHSGESDSMKRLISTGPIRNLTLPIYLSKRLYLKPSASLSPSELGLY
jgi:hypothetical protein